MQTFFDAVAFKKSDPTFLNERGKATTGYLLKGIY